jgi:hypothetical protein
VLAGVIKPLNPREAFLFFFSLFIFLAAAKRRKTQENAKHFQFGREQRNVRKGGKKAG